MRAWPHEPHRRARVDHALDDDVDALLAVRMGQDMPSFAARLPRLEACGWIAYGDDDYPELTPSGVEVVRRWLS